MPIDPQIQALLDLRAKLPPLHTLSVADAREQMAIREIPGVRIPSVASVVNRDMQGPAGSLPLRIYTPRGEAPFPLMVFFHGSGFVVCDLDTHDSICRNLCAGSDCVVVSVDYRLAPEHKFPAAVDDAVTATQWVADNAPSLGIDAARLSVGGDSAGGNLAAVVALAARDGKGPQLAGQVLIYPATDFAMAHPSHSELETSVLLTHSVIRWFRDHYLTGVADIHDWRASPAKAATLAGLPPAYVLTAGADPLRDEGDDYAQRLQEAGVPVTHRSFPGQFHGFFTMGKLLQQANVAASDIGAWLKQLN
jgi:acetyl esterase